MAAGGSQELRRTRPDPAILTSVARPPDHPRPCLLHILRRVFAGTAKVHRPGETTGPGQAGGPRPARTKSAGTGGEESAPPLMLRQFCFAPIAYGTSPRACSCELESFASTARDGSASATAGWPSWLVAAWRQYRKNKHPKASLSQVHHTVASAVVVLKKAECALYGNAALPAASGSGPWPGVA